MDHTKKFTGKARLYDQYRPGYPQACTQDLMIACGLAPGAHVADIGAGSGILTELLLRQGLEVSAVEPNQDMGTALKQRLKSRPGWALHETAAEQTGLPDACADAVTAAQAFHWFDQERFREECRRILKPGARVVLIWNNNDDASSLVKEMEVLCRECCPAFQGFHGGMDKKQEEISRFFSDGTCRIREFANPLSFNREGFLGRNLSSSYAPQKGDGSYDAFVKGLSALFERYGRSGTIIVPNHTRSYIGRP